MTVRGDCHGEIVKGFDGSDGYGTKAGPENDIQRTCHFSTKSRSTKLSLVMVKSGEQYPDGNPEDPKMQEDQRLLRMKTPASPRLLPTYRKRGELGKKVRKQNKAKGDFNEETQLQRQMRKAEGLPAEYPSMRQFRYFEQKHRKQEDYLISRNGLKNYQRNDRPLLGEGVQEYAPYIGVGILE